MGKIFILGGILIFIFGTANAVTADNQQPSGSLTSDSGINIGFMLANFYKKVISPVDGDRCPSLPTCSAYSAEAFKKHGFFIGWMMTVDRLIHEGPEEAKISPTFYHGGKWKVLDPVQNNDFWWINHDR